MCLYERHVEAMYAGPGLPPRLHEFTPAPKKRGVSWRSRTERYAALRRGVSVCARYRTIGLQQPSTQSKLVVHSRVSEHTGVPSAHVVGGGGGGGGVVLVGGGGGSPGGGWQVVDFTHAGHAFGSPSLAAVQVPVSSTLIGSLLRVNVQHPKQSQFFGANAAQWSRQYWVMAQAVSVCGISPVRHPVG